MDFNPFGSTTDALMFTWEELQSMEIEEQVGGSLNSLIILYFTLMKSMFRGCA